MFIDVDGEIMKVCRKHYAKWQAYGDPSLTKWTAKAKDKETKC